MTDGGRFHQRNVQLVGLLFSVFERELSFRKQDVAFVGDEEFGDEVESARIELAVEGFGGVERPGLVEGIYQQDPDLRDGKEGEEEEIKKMLMNYAR